MEVVPASESPAAARLASAANIASEKKFLRAYPFWLTPALVALVLTLIYLNPFIGDWDGLDYTVFSLRGEPSSMALGRSLFTLFNHGLYALAHALFGVRPEQAYLLFKFAVVAQTPLAVIVCWVLARDLTGSVRSATVAALLVALSPMLVIYGGQVMTDVPSVLLSASALVIHLRGVQKRRVWLILLGAALLGLGVNLRETAGLFLPWFVLAPFIGGWKLNRRNIALVGLSLIVFFVFAFGIWAAWFISNPGYRRDWHIWLSSMQSESARHPIGVANVRPFFVYFFLAAPLVVVGLPIAAWKEWRARGLTLTLLSAAVGLLATAMLFFNYSTTINWRYFLTGLPALAPLAGDFYARIEAKRFGSARRGFVTALVGIAFIGVLMILLVPPAGNEYFNRLALARTYDERLKLMPKDAVVIAGSQTIAVNYWRGIGAGGWDAIGVGAGWPQGKLDHTIENYLKSGRRVFLDTDPRWWQPCSWHVSEIEELAKIEKHFHFRRVAPTVFEVRPLDDPTAVDQPHLESLLPANRPEEVQRCFSSG